MRIILLVGFVLCWAVSVIAHDFPLPPRWDDIKSAAVETATGNSKISYRSDGPRSALLGTNCRGSGYCKTCESGLEILIAITSHIGNERTWKNGEQIACAICSYCANCSDRWANGICVYGQHMDPGEVITRKRIKSLLQQLRDHGCKRCGSIPLDPGNNVKHGELTVNVVTKGCGEKIC